MQRASKRSSCTSECPTLTDQELISDDDQEIRKSGGSSHTFQHAREMIELITRAGWRSKIKDLCVMQTIDRNTGMTKSWIFEDSLESSDYCGMVFQCKNDK